jgi:RecB family exonuclease
VITARSTRLLRVPNLRAMHQVIAETVASADPLAARACAVLVPTAGAGEALRRTLENLLLQAGRQAIVLPELLTRAGLYARLHEQLPGAPRMLSDFEREVLLRRAARSATRAGSTAPFRLRPGLIIEVLAFYDELRRQARSVADFDRLVTDTLAGSAEFDRGAERMLRQTRFLALAFDQFERSIDETGCFDEHRLRRFLLAHAGPPAFQHVVVTVADRTGDPFGLWTADYDLLARMTGLGRIDVIATENVLASGFHHRVHDLLPGIIEERCGSSVGAPLLLAPPPHPPDDVPAWFISRDREEELATVARSLAGTGDLERVGVVFQRPLPYLYLARQVFGDAGLPYQAHDALPLAAEPFAAALDLVFTFLTAEGTRTSLIELLGSPHWNFSAGGESVRVTSDDLSAADVVLRDRKYFGGWERLAALADELLRPEQSSGREQARTRRAVPAIAAAVRAASRLRDVLEAPTASAQIVSLIRFIREHERLPGRGDAWFLPHLRARAAVLGALEGLAEAHERHDDEKLPIAELAGTIRRWIEGQTFAPRTGSHGLNLLDAPAAAFAHLDEIWIVGLVESDWPERTARSIFYPATLLTQLGWPNERDRLSAARARFRDLLDLAHRRMSLSMFVLENDALVGGSAFLEEIDASGLVVRRRSASPDARIFVHEAISEEPIVPGAVRGDADGWLTLRMSRSSYEDPRFHGAAGTRTPATYAVSYLERYLECPFKYFASHVLRLEEERDAESGLTPQERGQVLHEVFEQFFARWHAAGNRTITVENLQDALEMFEEVAEARLADLSETDRAMERTYLLGSAVSPGLAERAFAFEIEHGTEVIDRLLEYPLEGEFAFEGSDGVRRLQIRAKADRIDLLAGDALRIVDYKLSRAPKPSRALQLPVYSVCAAQHLEGHLGRSWSVSRAGYVAFREKNTFVSLGGSGSLDEALQEGQHRLVRTVAAIEHGDFPPQPDEPFICTWCGYAPVCRKDYVGDD